MDKQDLLYLKKGFKLESPLITIDKIVTAYMKKETNEIIVSQTPVFPTLGEDVQELYLKNVKKLMSGKILSNIFELGFKDDSENIIENLTALFRDENFEDNCNELISRIADAYNFDTDIVINITRFVLNEDENNYSFMACTINKIKNQRKEFICDLSSQEFDTSYELNPMINITSPCDGFIYPSVEEKIPNTSNVLYYSAKKDTINETFVDSVIGAIPVLTAGEEREVFESILQDVFGGCLPKDTIFEIYNRLNNFKESSPLISSRSLKTLLKNTCPDKSEDFETVFEDKIEGPYDFTVDNLIPDFKTKSLDITNNDLDLNLIPETLSDIEIEDDNGQKYLKIPITDTLLLNGFNLTD